MHNAKREIVEKIVEREVVKEVRVGISEEELEAIHKKQHADKQEIMKQAQQDMQQLVDQQKYTAKEKAELQAALDREAADRRMLNEQKKVLAEKLKVSCLVVECCICLFIFLLREHLARCIPVT